MGGNIHKWYNRQRISLQKFINSSCCSRRRRWHPTSVLLPGKSHGQRSPVGCSPWGCSELDRTERLHFHFSPSCIGEGNGNPLQYSCLENPRDGGAWWAAVYGVAQSRTQLKRLSSSSMLLNIQKTNNPIQKEAEDLNRHFSQRWHTGGQDAYKKILYFTNY